MKLLVFTMSLVVAMVLSGSWGATSLPGESAVIEGETMSLPAAAGMPVHDSNASGGAALLIWTNASASTSTAIAASSEVVIRARGDQCAGAPLMTLVVDGRLLGTQTVSSPAWSDYPVAVALTAGTHSFAIGFTNDYLGSGCDRNLYVDRLSFAAATTPTPTPTPTAAPTPPTTSPLARATWYVDPGSSAARQAAAWSVSDPADAAQMEKIASSPQADWFGDWSGNVQAAVSARVGAIRAVGAMPVLVAYDIPLRDCGGYSSGGASSPAAYRSWIRGFAAGIGRSPAVVILEPDALAGLDCLSASQRTTRYGLLGDAVSVLAAHPGVLVYLDAGHSAWQSAGVMAGRLSKAGIAGATGFALNVSNFQRTADEVAYGTAISARVGGRHFVIDTSRNGLGPASDGQWCNPSGRALGPRPTARTGHVLVDAYLWIKRPGESDGTCNGGPAAGSWWSSYALGLAQRAAW